MDEKTRRGESGTGGTPSEHRGEDPRRAEVHAPKKPTHEKDQGFNESHGYPPGHGGPTGPGDTPATGDAEAHDEPRRGEGKSDRADDDAHDASRRSQADTHPDSRV